MSNESSIYDTIPGAQQDWLLARHGQEAFVSEKLNATMADFYDEQGMERKPWHLHSLNRVRGPEAMTGRNRLV